MTAPLTPMPPAGQLTAAAAQLAADGHHDLHQVIAWLEELAEVAGRGRLDLPHEEVPGGPIAASHMDGSITDTPISDHITARSMLADIPGLGRMPVLGIEFLVGSATAPPRRTTAGLFISDPAGMRGAGRLLRDTANAAANKATR